MLHILHQLFLALARLFSSLAEACDYSRCEANTDNGGASKAIEVVEPSPVEPSPVQPIQMQKHSTAVSFIHNIPSLSSLGGRFGAHRGDQKQRRGIHQGSACRRGGRECHRQGSALASVDCMVK